MVTATRGRPDEVAGLLRTLAEQELKPNEVIVVDGSEDSDDRTSHVVKGWTCGELRAHYMRAGGGAALQRNAGISVATGELVAFLDDDVRLTPLFLRVLARTLEKVPDDVICAAGRPRGVRAKAARRAGYRLLLMTRLIGTDRPGSYDWASGHPIPRSFEPEEPIREVDVVGGGASLWRREAFDGGLRFSEFFRTFFYREDMHLALVARRRYRLVTVADAQYDHLRSSSGRMAPDVIARHLIINTRFIFVDMVPERTRGQELRFWATIVAKIALKLLSPVSLGPSNRFRVAVGSLRGAVAAYRKWPGRFARVSATDRSDEI